MRAPRVIITRPEPDASRFAAAVRIANFDPILSPAVDIVWRGERPDLAGIGALAFTSANGVRALHKKRPPPALPAFVVGEATDAEARLVKFATVISASGDVASLAARILEAHRRGEIQGAVLHISGADQAGDLVGLLSAQGALARRVVLYEARPVETLTEDAIAALKEKPAAEWVALFSPRSAEIFLQQAERAKANLSHTVAACLSDAVAEIAGRARWAGIEVSDERSSAGLAGLIARKGFARP